MANEFVAEMKALRKEVSALKDAKMKAMMNFRLKEQQKKVTLTMNQNGYVTGLQVMSDKYAKIIATAKDGKTMIGGCTLRTVDDRTLDLRGLLTGQGQLGWAFMITDGNESDWQTVTGGGSVTASYTLDIRTTSDCEITITYEDNPYAPA